MTFKIGKLELPIFNNEYGNIKDPAKYLKKKTGVSWEISDQYIIPEFKILTTDRYDGYDNHCTLTSITSMLYSHQLRHKELPSDDKEIFNIIEKIATHNNMFSNEKGVPIYKASKLINKVIKRFKLRGNSTTYYYIITGFNRAFKKVANELSHDRPMMISFCGGYYHNHSTACYGYVKYKHANKTKIFLVVNDVWNNQPMYIDTDNIGNINGSFYALTTMEIGI